MREIKFRAWDKYDKRMWWNVQNAYDTLGIHCCEFQTKECPHDTLHAPSFGDIISDTEIYSPMQFTGLKDKNGKEIYEGDIINAIRFENEIVKYISDEWAFFSPFAGDESPSGDLEIIGNIYENPNLIK